MNIWTVIAFLLVGGCLGFLAGWWLSAVWQQGRYQRQEREQRQVIYGLFKMVLDSVQTHERSVEPLELRIATLPPPSDPASGALHDILTELRDVNQKMVEGLYGALHQYQEKAQQWGQALPQIQQREVESVVEAGKKEAVETDKPLVVSPRPLPDTRREERRPYRNREWVAFYDVGQLPSLDRFEPVHCLDISTVGLSFLYPARPVKPLLVVKLGHLPEVKYMKARVVHTGEETGGYRVGCEFIERLDKALFEPEDKRGRQRQPVDK